MLPIMKYKTCIGLFILYNLLTSELVKAQCPQQCSCVSYGAGQAVSCGPALSSFPSKVPSDTQIFSVASLPFQTPNNIGFLSEHDFTTFTNVKSVRISTSNIHTIAPNTFSKLSELVSLDLSDNKLHNLSRSIFHGLNTLTLLDLSDNRGCTIESDTFDDLSALKTLRLAGIGIYYMGNLLSKLTSLTTCDLHRNRLVRLDAGSFSHLSNLRDLDISFNDLREIQLGLKAVLFGLTSLKLEYNPWRCNCALIWTKTLPAKFVQPSYGRGGGIICDQPDLKISQYRDLRNVKDADMMCIPAHIDSCTYSVTAEEGKSVNFTCQVTGDPFPDVVWTMPDSTRYRYTLQANVTSQTTISLPVTIFSIHNGKWKVEVFNFNGSDSKYVDVNIIRKTTTTMTTTAKSTTTSTTTATTKSTTTIKLKSTLSALTTKRTTSSKLSTPAVASATLSSSSASTNISPGNFPGSQTMTSHGTQTVSQSSSPYSTTPSTSLPSHIDIVLIVAATSGGVVCMTGIILFIVIIYKTKRKQRIAARRKSVYSLTDDFGAFSRIKIGESFRIMD